MEIYPSITTQAIYGNDGRAALPFGSFVNDWSYGLKIHTDQHDARCMERDAQGRDITHLDIKERSKCVDKEHLGVPIVIALIPVSQRSHMYNHVHNMDNYMADELDYGEPTYTDMETISPEIYDALLNNVLLEPIHEGSDNEDEDENQKEKPVKKNKTHKKRR
jgi:hypothetical protein